MVLNKEEKRITQTYIVPNLDAIEYITMNYDEIPQYKTVEKEINYATNTIVEVEDFRPYLAFADIHSKILDAQHWLSNITGGSYVQKTDWKKNFERKEKEREERNLKKLIIKKEAFEKGLLEGEEKAKCSLKDIERIIEKKGWDEGFKDAKEMCKLSDKQILNMAIIITEERKLGYRKKEEE